MMKGYDDNQKNFSSPLESRNCVEQTFTSRN